MKKLFLLTLAAALFAGACATSGTGKTSTATTTMPTMTVDEAFQKIQQTREQLQQAKDNYLNAKSALDAANADVSVSNAIKKQLQKKFDNAKATYEAEKAAWAELLKN